MLVIDADLFVDLVTELTFPTKPLVEAKSLIAHCGAKRIDIQGRPGRNNVTLWDADTGEGAGEHRLQKFTRSRARQARNAWCLSNDLVAGRRWAALNEWLLVPWNRTRGRWDYEMAGRAPTTAGSGPGGCQDSLEVGVEPCSVDEGVIVGVVQDGIEGAKFSDHGFSPVIAAGRCAAVRAATGRSR